MINKALKLFIYLVAISLFFASGIFAQKTQDKTAAEETAIIIPKVIKVDDESIKEILRPKGKPLMVNFWATWCVPCREEFPELVELDKEYRGKIDLITISLDNLAEINRDVPKFLKEMKATMPAYLLRTEDENAVIGSISKEWQGGLPFTVIYDEKGEVAHTRQGKIKLPVVKEKLNKLLEKVIQTKNLPNNGSLYPNDKYNYENGLKDAKKDVADGKFIIKRYGLTPGIAEDSRKTLKEKYNIEYKDFGCVITPSLVKYIKGYNEISKAEIKTRFNLDF